MTCHRSISLAPSDLHPHRHRRAGAPGAPDRTWRDPSRAAIRDELAQLAGAGVAALVRIQYGGSVTPETSQALLEAENVDGFLVGGASLDAEQFTAIVGLSRPGRQ